MDSKANACVSIVRTTTATNIKTKSLAVRFPNCSIDSTTQAIGLRESGAATFFAAAAATES